jgi:hypothetical protein
MGICAYVQMMAAYLTAFPLARASRSCPRRQVARQPICAITSRWRERPARVHAGR